MQTPQSFGKIVKDDDSFLKAMLEKTKRIDTSAENLPTTHELKLNQHLKTVSAIEIEKNGSRMATGSYDYSVAFWEFAGMDGRLEPFRFIEPVESFNITCLSFSNDSQYLLVGTTFPKPQLFDRHGAFVQEFSSGDPYIRDMRKTSGHVAGIAGCGWDPACKDRFMTSSIDGTVRLWRTGQHLCQEQVVQVKAGLIKCPVTAAKFRADGKVLGTASADGFVRLFDAGRWNKPTNAFKAHAAEISSLIFCSDHILVTRGNDGSVKSWDYHNLSKPLGIATDLENVFAEAAIALSPDTKTVAVGTSVPKGGDKNSELVFLDLTTMKRHAQVVMNNSSVVGLAWHPILNQIFAGMSDGSISINFDPNLSAKGILLPISKQPHLVETAVFENLTGPIVIPISETKLEIPETRSEDRQRLRFRKDNVISRRPETALEGPGRGGKIGSTITQSIMKTLIQDKMRDEDPREALLKWAQVAQDEPYFITPAYQETQPTPILDAGLLRQEEEKERRKRQSEENAAILSKKISKNV